MAKVKTIVRGYVRSEGGVERASCAVTYVEENGVRVIIDPGMDREALVRGLADAGVRAEDIDYVVLTHTHLDHVLLASVFGRATFLDIDASWTLDGTISTHEGKVPGTDITIVPTPGHDPHHASVIAQTADLGTVAVAGDVFWWADDETRESDIAGMTEHADKYVKDMEALRASRRKVLEMADYIVPGHGDAFRVPGK